MKFLLQLRLLYCFLLVKYMFVLSLLKKVHDGVVLDLD